MSALSRPVPASRWRCWTCTVVDWGNDNSGQLGDGSENAEYGPVAVSGLSKVTAISAGGYDGLALLEDGTVKAWVATPKENGDGTSTGPSKCGTDGCSLTPIAVSALSRVTALTSGLSDSYALLSGGKVMAGAATPTARSATARQAGLNILMAPAAPRR